MNKYRKALQNINEVNSHLFENVIPKEDYDVLEELVITYENMTSNRDKEFVDQLHYVHEHVYACQGDYYANGGYINYYHIEKLETAKRVLENSLEYFRRRYFGK